MRPLSACLNRSLPLACTLLFKIVMPVSKASLAVKPGVASLHQAVYVHADMGSARHNYVLLALGMYQFIHIGWLSWIR